MSRRRAPVLRRPAFAVAFCVLGLLLFSLPFVRVPRPNVVLAYLQLFATWTAAVAVLWLMSRRVTGGDAASEDERD